jgi:hypothetical protein
MPDFDPEKDNGWSLREAIMRAGNPLLASVAQKRLELGEQPHWWMPQLAPEPLLERWIKYDYLNPQRDYELTVQAVETAFRIKLVNGELVCWARPGAPHESHKRLARGAWGALVVEDWIFGTLRAGTRDARMDFVPVRDGPRYYDARVEPSSDVEGEAASPANIEAWYRGYVRSGEPISERIELEAAEKHFGRAISREPFREMRRRVLPALLPDLQDEEQPGRLRIGRRSGNCAGK